MTYPCLVLDHDDTVVNSTATVHYPCFAEYTAKFFPRAKRYTLEEYVLKNFDPGVYDFFHGEVGMTEEDMKHEGEGIIRLGYVIGFPAGKLGGNLIHVILEDIHGRYIGVEVRLLREDFHAYLAVGVQSYKLQLGDLRRLYPAVADVIYEFRIAYLFDRKDRSRIPAERLFPAL